MTIRLNNAAKTFPDGTKALLPTELTVKTGEIVSLLGPSGCGKTTLLRIISGLETSNPGSEIWFDDDNVTLLPVERRNVGMVFQSYALFPNMSVRANIGYGLKIQKLSKLEIDSRVNEVLEMCQLQDFSARAISQLSGGQRQRVALARAIAPRPRLLLLDEPLSALDAAMREDLRDELKPTIVEQQIQGNWWNIVYQPLGFLLFFIAALAECNRTPFDLPECETELVGGHHTEYSSMKLGFYLFAEYINMFVSSAIMASLYFGGYNYPFMHLISNPNLAALIGVVAFFTKIFPSINDIDLIASREI